MGREPIPLTPEILQLLDKLEPDKGKQAKLLTEYLTGQRTLPSTEQELQTQLERKAAKEIQRQQTATEAAANQAATEQHEADRRAHEAAMAAHLGQHVYASTIAAGATPENATATTMGEEGLATMQD